MIKHVWVRVTQKHPCKVCGKPDYCTYAPDAGLIQCQRVESERESKSALGGWIHRSGDPLPLHPRRREKTPTLTEILDAQSLIDKWRLSTNGEIDQLARDLGVTARSLHDIGTVWAEPHRAWGFPMVDANGLTIGIRLRGTDGQKWAVKNSRAGVFFPSGAISRLSSSRVFICEGPTDTAALLSIGLFAIGRPSCLGCEELICGLLANLGAWEAVLLTDNDAPGLRGAEKLSKALKVRTAFLVPPAKDARAFVANGGSAALLGVLLNNCVWKCR